MMEKTIPSSVLRLNKRNLIYVFCTGAIFLAQLSENYDSQVYMGLGYGVIIVCSFFCAENDILGMILFLLPDNRLFDIGGISIQLYLMGLYIVKYTLIRKRKIFKNVFLWALLLSIYSLSYITGGIGNVLLGLKVALMIIFYTVYLSNSEMNKVFYEIIIKYAVYGLFTSFVVAVMVDSSILSLSRVYLSDDSNQNMFGILGAILFSHSLMSYFQYSEKKYILYGLMSISCALISTSRTALLAVGFSVIWCLIVKQKGKNIGVRKALIFTLISVFIIGIILGQIEISYVTKLIDRIVNPRRGDISNGRFTLWAKYIEILKTDMKILVFGNGSALIEGVTTLTDTTRSLVAHNLVIEQMVMYGLVGNIIVVGLYLSSYKKLKKQFSANKIGFAYALNIIIVFVVGIFSHLLTSVLVTTELYLGIIQYLSFRENKALN